MPLIQCHIKRGLSPEQKDQLMRDLTEATHITLGADPKFVAVVIHEHDASNIKEIDYVSPYPGDL
jgi:4-oxalocrotonate tautomerase/trans-3-chloroacrylic acid dehalogenase beta subunit